MNGNRESRPDPPRKPKVVKPVQPPPGPRVDPRDPVEEASNESFPASDPPAMGGGERERERRIRRDRQG